MRKLVGVLSLVVSLGVWASAAAGAPAYVQVAGSPFTGPAQEGWSIAFNTSGNLLATTYNVEEGTPEVAVFRVNPITGATILATTKTLGDEPIGVAFGTASGHTFLAVAQQTSVDLYSVAVSGTLTQIEAITTSPSLVTGVAFNSAGTRLALSEDDAVTTYAVSTSGLTSPHTQSLGNFPTGAAFSPSGSLLAIPLYSTSQVQMLKVAPNGSLTAVSGSPPSTGSEPVADAFSPTGNLLAVVNNGDHTLSMFSVNQTTGQLTTDGSPKSTGNDPTSVAFSPSGHVLATSNFDDSTLSLFSVNSSTGALSGIGLPLPTGTGNKPDALAFNPNGLLAAADWDTGAISVFALPPPTAVLSEPGPASHVYRRGSSVPIDFRCADSPYGPGLASCADSNGAHPPVGHLATKTIGYDTYEVTARSKDGQTAHVTLAYTVADPPTASLTSPKSGRTYRLHQRVRTTFSCQPGAFGPEVASCTDSNGASAPHGRLNTSKVGKHTYTVVAFSLDGMRGSKTITYRVKRARRAR